MAQDNAGAVKSADRVMDLVELLARAGTGLTHSDIAGRLDIPKSSLTPLLRNMIGRGYVAIHPDGRRYRLGATFFELLKSADAVQNLPRHAEAFLRQATRDVGESSAFNQLQGDEQEVVATVLGPHRLVTYMKLGERAPLYATSSGKVILCHMPASYQAAYIETVRFRSWTPSTINSRPDLLKELKATKASGFGYSFEEFTKGIVGIAAVVRGSDGLPLGAMNFAIPKARFDDELKARAQRVLKQCARDLERAMTTGL